MGGAPHDAAVDVPDQVGGRNAGPELSSRHGILFVHLLRKSFFYTHQASTDPCRSRSTTKTSDGKAP